MPFDDKQWQKLAKQGDVAGIAIHVASAIRSLNLAILTLQRGDDPAEYIKDAGECAEALHKFFQELSGYIPDGE